MDKSKFQYEGMKWLFELELLNHPQVVNTIRFNVLIVSRHIKEVELLIYRENKSMLVLLELGWIGRTFQKKRIFTEVQEVLSMLLPSFRFRVTDDPRIMELAVERVKKALTGGSNESTSNSSDTLSKQPAQQDASAASAIASTTASSKETSGSRESSGASAEESSQTTEEIRAETGKDDSSKE